MTEAEKLFEHMKGLDQGLHKDSINDYLRKQIEHIDVILYNRGLGEMCCIFEDRSCVFLTDSQIDFHLDFKIGKMTASLMRGGFKEVSIEIESIDFH